jgi:anti-sigma B factor antagonist
MTDRPPPSHDEIPLLRVEQETRGDAVVVRADGDIDLATAPLLAEHLRTAASRLGPGGLLVLDMRGVEFLASPGLAEMIESSQRCAEHGARLVVVADQRAVLRAMELTGLTQIITVTSTVEDALGVQAGT